MSKLLGPIKLMVRQDEQAGIIRAYLATTDESEKEEVGSLSIAAARKTPGLFEGWVKVMQEIPAHFLRDVMGVEPLGFERFKPPPLN